MSGEQLNLDDILSLRRVGLTRKEHVDLLVAEVRRLRSRFRLCDGCDATMVRCNEHVEAGAIKCCPDCKHSERP